MATVNAGPIFNVGTASLSFSVCTLAFVFRGRHYHKLTRQNKSPVFKFSALEIMSFSSLLAGVITAGALIAVQTEWFFGDERRWCTLSYKLNAGVYAVHRTFLYLFIVWRIEVINVMKVISKRTLKIGKIAAVLLGALITCLAMIYAKGGPDDIYTCGFIFPFSILLVIGVIDFIVCGVSTWIFILPIRKILTDVKSRRLKATMNRTTLWSAVSLVSTMITLAIVGLIDGLAGVVAIDCAVSCSCIVLVLRPIGKETAGQTRLELTRGQSSTNTSQVSRTAPSASSPPSGPKLTLPDNASNPHHHGARQRSEPSVVLLGVGSDSEMTERSVQFPFGRSGNELEPSWTNRSLSGPSWTNRSAGIPTRGGYRLKSMNSYRPDEHGGRLFPFCCIPRCKKPPDPDLMPPPMVDVQISELTKAGKTSSGLQLPPNRSGKISPPIRNLGSVIVPVIVPNPGDLYRATSEEKLNQDIDALVAMDTDEAFGGLDSGKGSGGFTNVMAVPPPDRGHASPAPDLREHPRKSGPTTPPDPLVFREKRGSRWMEEGDEL